MSHETGTDRPATVAGGRCGLPVALAAVGAMLALGALAWLVLRDYSIHAWSDPVNWLVFGRDLRTEFFTNRLACGYPLFLSVVEPLTGPYRVFLINLPLILLVIVAAGGLAARLVPAARPWERAAAFLLTVAGIAVFDPWLVRAMTNPYRDPLSHLLLIAALLVVSGRPLRGTPGAGAPFGAGLLFGLAYTVREPALLVAIPLGLLLFWLRGSRPGYPFWKAAGWAAAGALLGAAPLVAQGLARAGGAGLLPPQVLAEKRLLPGMHLVAFAQVAGQVWDYLCGPPAGLVLLALPFLAGVVMMARDRNVPAVLLLGLPALIYALFYGFYWSFIPRYVWIAVVFGMAAGAYGIARLLGEAGRFLPAAGRFLPAGAGLLACAAAAVWLGFRPPLGEGFKMDQARDLTRAVAAEVPAGVKVLAARNACEVIRWFNALDAYPASWHWAAGAVDPTESLRERLAPVLASGRRVWAAEVRMKGRRDIEFAAVRRAFDVERRGNPIRFSEYGLWPAEVRFWEIFPWSATSTVTEVYAPQPGLCLQVDTRGVGPDACLVLDGDPACPAVSGANFFRLRTAGPHRVVLSAPGGVPRSMGIRLYLPTEPVLLDFDPTAEPSCAAWLGEGIRRPPYGRSCVRIERSGDVRIPAPLLDGPGGRLVLRLRGAEPAPAPDVRVRVRSAAGETDLSVPADRRLHECEVPAPAAGSGKPVRVTIEVLNPDAGQVLELEWIAVHSAGGGTSAAP